MGAFPAFMRRGQGLPGPSSLPSQAGQTPTWNADGTFAGWRSPGASAPLNLISGASTQVPLSVQAHASQTANLFEIRDSAGTAQSYFSSNRGLTINSSSDPAFDVTWPFRPSGGAKTFAWKNGPSEEVLSWNKNTGFVFGWRAQFSDRVLFNSPFQATINGYESITVKNNLGAGVRSCIAIGPNWGSTTSDSVPGQLNVCTNYSGQRTAVFRAATSQTVPILEIRNPANAMISAIDYQGAFSPPSIADAAATNNTIYFSTDASKLVYKDSAGVVNSLY